uniref:Uncharacterized protein n=1 Tax=Chromera velia CCMP2878 TaxID=1169474 RepID=A0A0G4G6P7_9ALVE|eukprot:Cvel_20502.t1-p1 / transcript=Cvel_20502.t1 / gene=Cvel_20502 / organism=Chromera_velia_CCMP2878 / gene_product=hypothetical protein / transcript_product=hypothetical protein / location=Cvel_scaffold1845:5500-9542(-) / protein_length=308 / sequence_SO=supercontig / SO=protein_coding / is_pseudo=false
MESLIRKTMPWYTIQRPAGPLQILLQRRDSGAFWVANAIRIPEEKGKAEEELRGWGTEKSPNFVGVQSGAVWGERGEGGGVVIVTKHQVFDARASSEAAIRKRRLPLLMRQLGVQSLTSLLWELWRQLLLLVRELLSVNSESGERAGLTARRVMMELKGLVSHGNAQVDQGTVTVVRNAGDIASLARGETSFETVLEELAVLREGGVENEEGGRRVQELESAAIFADPVQEKGGAVWGLRGGEMDLSSLEESKRLWEGLSCRANVPPTPKETSEGDEEEREETEEDPLTWWEWLGSCCSCVSRDVPEQ